MYRGAYNITIIRSMDRSFQSVRHFDAIITNVTETIIDWLLLLNLVRSIFKSAI